MATFTHVASGQIFHLLERGANTIGRSECTIVVPNDPAVSDAPIVSRRHATITFQVL